MKALLNIIVSFNTLGVNIFKTKTLTKWLSELSQKFHFLPSYWQPAYFYGQTSTQQTRLKSQQILRKTHYAFQEVSTTQIVSERETNKTSLNLQVKTGRLHGLTESLKIEGFKLRLFNGLFTFWDNKRLRWGMLLLMLIAPLSKYFYLLLPEAGFGKYLVNVGPLQILNTVEGLENGWYFAYYSQYFWSIGELLAPVISIFGIFLLFPKKYYPAYLVGVPFGYYFSLLIHRMFFVTDYVSFHGGATTTMTMTFLLLGVVFFMVSDKVLFRQNHRKRASEARIIGLINMPGMGWNDKEEIIRKEVAEVMKVDNELFIKESA
jgi:hypothetical protein